MFIFSNYSTIKNEKNFTFWYIYKFVSFERDKIRVLYKINIFLFFKHLFLMSTKYFLICT